MNKKARLPTTVFSPNRIRIQTKLSTPGPWFMLFMNPGKICVNQILAGDVTNTFTDICTNEGFLPYKRKSTLSFKKMHKNV